MTRNPRFSAAATASRQIVVLPIPGDPFNRDPSRARRNLVERLLDTSHFSIPTQHSSILSPRPPLKANVTVIQRPQNAKPHACRSQTCGFPDLHAAGPDVP